MNITVGILVIASIITLAITMNAIREEKTIEVILFGFVTILLCISFIVVSMEDDKKKDPRNNYTSQTHKLGKNEPLLKINEIREIKVLIKEDTDRYSAGYTDSDGNLIFVNLTVGFGLDLKYDEDIKTHRLVREENIKDKYEHYTYHYILYIGSETGLDTSRREEGLPQHKEVKNHEVIK